MQLDMERTRKLIDELFRITGELTDMTARPFTPDGHLVGSLGEVIAASAYGLDLEPPSTKACDAKDKKGRRIEIKATFSDRVAFRRHEVDCEATHCIVLQLQKDAGFEEIYNGPMRAIHERLSLRQLPSNGQIQISLRQLRVLNTKVDESERLRRIR